MPKQQAENNPGNFADRNSEEYIIGDGSKIAVIGGGPAGSFFSHFFLEMAEMMELEIQLDIYEPRDFTKLAPIGCNMCGGIISETLVQYLAADGINLTEEVVQRGLDSYVLHSDVGSVRIEAPLEEKRIAAVHRGMGPRDLKEMKWVGFDGYLQEEAVQKGANIIHERILSIAYVEGKPVLKTRNGETDPYDLVTVATGVNSPLVKAIENLNFGYQAPKTVKTSICEYYFGGEVIRNQLGNSMHVFLLNIPHLEFAAIIPKGDYATVCLLGDDINDELIMDFLNTAEFEKCMPDGWVPEKRSCNCQPRINIGAAVRPYHDRLVVIGDSGVARLYKDGIGAAYRTAKAAASTAIFQGVSARDFESYYLPACKRIARDNMVGKVTFFITTILQKFRFTRHAMLKMTLHEQLGSRSSKPMSTVMWDMFTGSASYREIFLRAINPLFLFSLAWHILVSILSQPPIEHKSKPASEMIINPMEAK